ncbi:YlqD family protein [Paenalkalicoccus suaedae]|uniref:YlqD family protein n=1 Tax=Paenalkalicoccus suaedae TaxID=2592382 RepID=A0A859FET5_9BACI|nr:YlqD family protein [Paenalkalicoccus suaedae]QKS71461.1 YlqD family protein [Paenalkalicoccus suaedae]
MEIIKKVVVKQILTEDSRTKLKEQFLSRQYQLTKELKQLEFVLHKKMKENTDPNYQKSLKESFNKEVAKRKERIRQLELKLGQLDELEIGAELREGTIQMIEKVEEGDNWEDILKGTEIVIKDGIVHELRDGGGMEDE